MNSEKYCLKVEAAVQATKPILGRHDYAAVRDARPILLFL